MNGGGSSFFLFLRQEHVFVADANDTASNRGGVVLLRESERVTDD